jgi:hypothetical protein
MTTLSDQNRHPGFLQSGQLTLYGAAIIVLLIFKEPEEEPREEDANLRY